MTVDELSQQRTGAVPALRLYAQGLRIATAGLVSTLQVCDESGRCTPLAVAQWCGDRVPGDGGLLAECRGTTLDVGCGPGRLTAALATLGVHALGIDVAAAAVRLTRQRGAAVAHASVFGPLPAEGRWDTVLLADGNIGIGGDPVALLRRCRTLIAPCGQVVTELDPPGGSRAARLQLRSGHQHSEWFDWAHVGADALPLLARGAGLAQTRTWTEAGRWFAALARA
jgi:SAM-dependent methyltransferase